MADVTDRQHVLQADRLAADQVGSGFHTDEGDLVGRLFLDDRTEPLQVEIAFERIVALGDQALLVEQFEDFTTQAGDVGFRGREMEVHQGEHPRLDEGFGQDVLGSAALMGGQHVVDAKDLLDGGLGPVEGFRTGIGVVGDLHGGHLQVGHGIDTGIGDHVHIDVTVLEQESIVAGFLDGFEPFSDGKQGEFLDNADLVHFKRHLVFGKVEFDRHEIKGIDIVFHGKNSGPCANRTTIATE